MNADSKHTREGDADDVSRMEAEHAEAIALLRRMRNSLLIMGLYPEWVEETTALLARIGGDRG